MRNLEYHIPVPITKTYISNAFILNQPTENHYERALNITTRYGLVIAFDFHWPNNFGSDSYTEFSTVRNGYKYSATLKQSRLSDNQLKWLATHFIKNIVQK